MKRIKWFQRFMIVFLVSVNVLFYCLKMNFKPIYVFSYTGSAILIAILGIFIYKQSSKRLNKISMAKFRNNNQ